MDEYNKEKIINKQMLNIISLSVIFKEIMLINYR